MRQVGIVKITVKIHIQEPSDLRTEQAKNWHLNTQKYKIMFSLISP